MRKQFDDSSSWPNEDNAVSRSNFKINVDREEYWGIQCVDESCSREILNERTRGRRRRIAMDAIIWFVERGLDARLVYFARSVS